MRAFLGEYDRLLSLLVSKIGGHTESEFIAYRDGISLEDLEKLKCLSMCSVSPCENL